MGNALTQDEIDADLERRIDAARMHALHGKTPADRKHWFDELKRLVSQRSWQQVDRMERERGLRP